MCAVAAMVLAVAGPVPAGAQDPMLVRLEQVRFEPLTQTVPVIGRLVSLRSGNLAARIGGPVKQIFVEVGHRVTEGQVVAVLDDEALKADKALAESELLEARADHKSWMAEEEQARTELRRFARLKGSAAFSQARFEDAEKKVAVAAAKVKRAEAKIAIKEAALERKIIDVEYATLRAPYDGVVVQRQAEVGTYVNKGDPICRIIGDRSLEIEADVPFRRLAGVSVGRTVDVTLDDGSRHTATVRAVLPSENPLTRTRAVRFAADFAGAAAALAESQSVTIAVPIGAERRVLTVHKDAILKRQGGDLVFVVKDGVAQPRVVQLGESVASRIEVLAGLEAGERVVVRGNERLQPGAKVRVEKGST